MDRCALFVDAGYLLADGAMAVHGTRNRDSVSWDYAGLARLLEEVARDRTGLPLLRCYWYEATADGRRSQEQDGIADIPGIKFRAARIRPGRREGVESYVQRDLTTLARTGTLCEAVLVSGDEDMAQVVADVQDLGVRVTVVHVSVEGNWTISRALRRECDDLIEIGAGHLRPYVTLLSGAAAAESAAETTAPLANGHGRSAPETERRPVTAHPESDRVEPAPPASPAPGLEPVFAGTGAQQPMSGSAMDQLRAMRRSIAQQRGGDHLAPQAGAEPPRSASGPIDANGFPTGPRASHAPSATGAHQSLRDASPGASATGAHGGLAAASATGPQPAYGAPPQPVPQQPVQPAQPPQQAQTGAHAPMAAPGHPAGPRHHQQPAGYEHEAPPGRAPAPPDPRYGPTTGENPGFGGGTGPNPTFGTSTEGDSPRGGAPGVRPPDATGPRLRPRVQHGPYTDPVPSADYAGASAARTIEEAVNVARREGNDFAESIARDAPALWLEAVLVRRPRMPSDLEARLLQGSALPIDYLLRDEVREALRQGFWEALERARE
ncbi:NYN domain-containing protein [Nocardiopsis potens]|uniref:NYN domain-containing protein n=1 Tax=Nocardiopsis potens TaxID=1246458 RepID=UPI0003776B93|nr:NYN domain-containing protein [Nocardiopsis potens]